MVTGKKNKFNTACSSGGNSQGVQEFLPYTLCSWCILLMQPIAHSFRSCLCSFRFDQWSCQTSQHESTWLLTIFPLGLQGNRHGGWVYPGWRSDTGWRRAARLLFLVLLFFVFCTRVLGRGGNFDQFTSEWVDLGFVESLTGQRVKINNKKIN